MINETLEAERAYHKGLSEEYYRGYRAAKDEIVHCRDCAGCEYDTALDQYWCTRGRLIIGRHVMPDDFCSYGERREE